MQTFTIINAAHPGAHDQTIRSVFFSMVWRCLSKGMAYKVTHQNGNWTLKYSCNPGYLYGPFDVCWL